MEYEKPLRILQALQIAQVERDRAAIIRELVTFTHTLIERYREPIQEQHVEMTKMAPSDKVSMEKLRIESTQLFSDIQRANQAFKRMNEFLAAHPGVVVAPEEQQCKTADQAQVQDAPQDGRVESMQAAAVPKAAVAIKTDKGSTYLDGAMPVRISIDLLVVQ